MNTEKVLERIMSGGETNPRRIADRIDAYAGILKRVTRLEQTIESEKKRHEEGLRILEDERKKIQNYCDHPDVRHIPDASGGYDNEDLCELCGKRL